MKSSKERKKRPDLYIIAELLNNEGYTQTELSERTGGKDPNISKYIRKFRKSKIVYLKSDLEKQELRGKGSSDDYIYVGPREDAKPEEKLKVFQFILKSFFEEPRWDATQKLDFTEKLLASKYVNSLIEECGLKPFYKIIEEFMEREEFRRIASQTLLDQPALIEEYIKLPTLMKEYIETNRDYHFLEQMRDFTKYLKILFGFKYIDSIKFHRQFLAEPFGKLYRDLTQRDVPRTRDMFVTEGIRKFLELDLFLSPLTSYPINYPVELLFEKPFERLYTDLYIYDEQDIKRLVRRAYIVYSNFISVVSAGVVNSGVHVDDLEILLKQYIFFWNVASRNLDYLYWALDSMLTNEREAFNRSTLYHIYSEATGLQMMDLTNKNLLLSRGTKNEMNYHSLTIDLDDPTKDIRICYCFGEEGLEAEELLFEDVLLGIRSKLKNATVVKCDGRLAYGTGFMEDAKNRRTGTLHGEVVLTIPNPDENHPFSEEEEQKIIKQMQQFRDNQLRQNGHD